MRKIDARDSQRQKLYDAEAEVPAYYTDSITDIHELRKYVKKITKSAWYRRRFTKWAEIEVKDGRRRRKACGCRYGGYINMPVWARRKMIVLHELSHVVQPDFTAGHGREFCKIYLAFVKKWLGRETYEQLKTAFKNGGVKYVTGNVKV